MNLHTVQKPPDGMEGSAPEATIKQARFVGTPVA